MRKLIHILLLLSITYSCTIQKRRHLSGFHVQFYKFHPEKKNTVNDLTIKKQNESSIDSNHVVSYTEAGQSREDENQKQDDGIESEVSESGSHFIHRTSQLIDSESEKKTVGKSETKDRDPIDGKSSKDKKQVWFILLGLILSILTALLSFYKEFDTLGYFIILSLPIQLILLLLKQKIIRKRSDEIGKEEDVLPAESGIKSYEIQNFKIQILYAIVGFAFSLFTTQFFYHILLMSLFLILAAILLLVLFAKKKNTGDKIFNKRDLAISLILLVFFCGLAYFGCLGLVSIISPYFALQQKVFPFIFIAYVYGIILPLLLNLLYYFFPFYPSTDHKSIKSSRLNNISHNYVFLGLLPSIFPTSPFFGLVFGLVALYRAKKENNEENEKRSKKNIWHHFLNILLYLLIIFILVALIYFSII